MGAAQRYTREELLALRDTPGCRDLPPGLEADDLSDLQESCFFDKAPTPDAGIYLGPQRGPGGPGARAPFTAGPARRAAGAAAGPIHSRLIEEDERAAYQRTNSGQLQTAFGSPSKPQAIAGRGAGGRFADPSKMDRWDSQKLAAGPGAPRDPENWQQQKTRVAGAGAGDNWRANAGGVRASLDTQRAGAGWGGGSTSDLPRSGSSAPKDNGGGRWVKDDDDWRARKQAGAVPEPRYDWSDNRAQAAAAAAAPGAAARGPPPGFHDRGERAPEWADSDAGMRPRMTAADIEAERLRMQEQWKKGGGNARSAADSSMAEIMTDDDIMSMMQEEQEKQGQDGGRPAANGKPDAAPKAGQHVDVAALLGGRPQPSSPGGIGSPASATGSERAGAEGVRSRFANFFKLEDALPAPGAAAGGPGAAAPGAAAPGAPGGPTPQQLSFQEQLSRAAAGGQHGMPAMPTAHASSPGEIEQRMQAGAPPGGAPPPGQARDAGQALLAMLKQQQAAQRAAAGGGQAPRPVMPPNAVSAADVTVLEQADKVARLTALQGLDDDMLGETRSPPPPAAQMPPPQQQRGPLPPGMQLPPGAMPPPHGQPGPPPPGMHGFGGQLPPGQLPPGMIPGMHMPPPPGAPFPPHGMQHMGPMPPGMQHGPPPPGMQYRPPGGAAMQYRPPGVGLPPQPGMQPGMQPPQQGQQAQQNALLAQLLAAQAASRGAPPPQQQAVQPGQQINLAALLGAAGNPGMQLPPMPQTALNPAQLQGLQGMRPPAGMMPPGMHNPGLPPGISPQLLQQLQMQQQGLQRPMPPPMHHPPSQQQLSSAQLMAALGLAQGGMPQQGLR